MTGYVCHDAHGAAVTTVVQFNPILLPVATRLGTLNPAYLAETSKRNQITRFNPEGGLRRPPKNGQSHELASKSSCQFAALPGKS
jgi:hypothetical protein